MNPSIHFDGETWRCVLRCTDYAMPGGVTIRSRKAKPGQSRTKNAMVVFDPSIWKPVEIYKMHEQDDLDRATSGSVGYEDIRLFRTDRHGLQGIAAALHLRRSDRGPQLAEQVLLWFDEAYNITDARPIRGGGGAAWSRSPQKNWVPFDHCAEPRFLYTIDQGTLFDDYGKLRDGAIVQVSTRPRRPLDPGERTIKRAQDRAIEVEIERAHEERGRRSLGWAGSLPRAEGQSHVGLRGGSQLVRIDDDSWLAIGHAMKIVDGLKLYWHVWYLVDARGRLMATSGPMKLADSGIEFAAGLAVDSDRVVVSFGVDDMLCQIGETSLAAVVDLLRSFKDRR